MSAAVYTKERRLVAQVRSLVDELESAIGAKTSRGKRSRAGDSCTSYLQEATRALLLANVALRAGGGVSGADLRRR